MKNRVKELRKKLGMTQTELAELVNKSMGTIHRVESGEHGLSDKKAEIYAKALKVRPEELFTKSHEARIVTVKSHVQAGHWEESLEWNESEWYEIAVPDDEQFRPYQLYAAEAKGPSMNKRYPEGTVLVFTNVTETQEEAVFGKRYVVERKRVDGLREATVKLLHRDENDKQWLLPETTDPLFQQPIEVNGDEGETIRILGRVRFAVSRE